MEHFEDQKRQRRRFARPPDLKRDRVRKGLAMKALTKEQRRVVARRLFEALRVHYPNRYISLIGRPVSTKLMIVGGTAIQSTITIAASKAAPPDLRAAAPRVES